MQKEKIQLLSDDLYENLLQQAETSTRKRMNYNFHESMEDNPHRFLNVLLKGTYIPPHRHLRPPKSESFVILKGNCLFFVFDDEGNVEETYTLSDAKGFAHGIDIAPGVWHTLAVLSEHAICFEVKPGPYRQSDDKEFAPWAPAEGESGCDRYLKKLLEN